MGPGKVDLREELKVLCRTFEKYRVKYLLIGGLGVILQGIPRHTDDIDFMLSPEPENIEQLKKALYEVFQDESVWEISPEDIKYAVIRYGTPKEYAVDLLFRLGEVADYKSLKSYEETILLEGIPVKTLSKEGLIFLKKDTPRPQDQYDVYLLKKLLEKEKKDVAED
ncbi:nucleotidyl transferase AbiEii/AbiGii toxin family protein [Thermosulfurimonas sp. F29]|uniref:nucleotidyl transferase AbiEii/AbiGii toxin family protein n=1 Tax=Thermosulfurimonas sp. F29 TaxID=2867247 RepID=UPI001C836D72|nr:nucleotidyl transferase AbiEii/AbiGii toxin family protein [Thermosulfurimonas sp. F29]MBX6422382.1 nucleotidyltransferase [Thermosulfurimonas sp. F29]